MLGHLSRNLCLQQGRGFIKTPPDRKASMLKYINGKDGYCFTDASELLKLAEVVRFL